MGPWILDISANGDSTPFLGSLWQCLRTLSFWKKIKDFSYIDGIFVMFQFVTVTLFLSCHRTPVGDSPLDLHHIFTNSDQIFLRLLFPSLDISSSLSLSSYGRHSCSSITFMALYWTLSSMSMSLVPERPELDKALQVRPH